MKKLLLLMLLVVGGVFYGIAATVTTVYYAVPSSVVGSYTVKLNVNYKGDGNDWGEPFVMTKSDKTFLDSQIYTCTFEDKYNGLGELQFQLCDGDTWKSQVVPFDEWTPASEYNGKMWVHGGNSWITYNYDISKVVTIHCKKTESWTPTHAYDYYSNGTGDTRCSDEWPGTTTTQNTLNNDYYDITINRTLYNSTLIFNDGTKDGSIGGTNQTYNITIADNPEYWVTEGPTSWQASTSVPENWIGYTRSVTSGNFGTICLPYAATVTDANVYKIVSKIEDGSGNLTGINLDPVDALEAGKAYIFQATGSTLTATYSGSYTEASAGYGMMGNLSSGNIKAPLNTYVVSGKQIHKVTGSEVIVGQYRGYIIPEDIDPTEARGALFIGLDENATVIESISTNREENKDIIFNLQGQRVTDTQKGLLLLNGKKVIRK